LEFVRLPAQSLAEINGALNLEFLSVNQISSHLGFVTSLAPGLVETSSQISVMSEIISANAVQSSVNSSSIFSLGSFGKVAGLTASANVVVFGLVIR
jgi:hypothetical protein